MNVDTEFYLADWFAEKYGSCWRYDHSWKTWFVFRDGRWNVAGEGELDRSFIAAAMSLNDDARRAGDSGAASHARYALRSSATTIRRILRLIGRQTPVAIFDANDVALLMSAPHVQ